MTLILNGTDNSATTPAVTGTDTDTGVYYPTTNQVALATNGTLALIVDASQNVGIGVTPSAWANTWTALQIKNFGLMVKSDSNWLYSNSFYNGSNYYASNGYAGVFDFNGQVVGGYALRIAPSGLTNGAVTYTQVLAIEKDKSLALQGATSATGTGITFPATQSASSDANTLDDYEEGTWTPQAGSESGAFTATYTLQSAKYVKIGNRVWATWDCWLASRTSTGSIALLYGLPFPVANNGDLSGSYGSVDLTQNAGVNYYAIATYAQNNSSYCYLTVTTSNTSNLAVAQNTLWGATTRIVGGVVYNTTS